MLTQTHVRQHVSLRYIAHWIVQVRLLLHMPSNSLTSLHCHDDGLSNLVCWRDLNLWICKQAEGRQVPMYKCINPNPSANRLVAFNSHCTLNTASRFNKGLMWICLEFPGKDKTCSSRLWTNIRASTFDRLGSRDTKKYLFQHPWICLNLEPTPQGVDRDHSREREDRNILFYRGGGR